MKGVASAVLAVLMLVAGVVSAHPLAPSLLQLEERSDGRFAVLWKTPLRSPSGSRGTPGLPTHCQEVEPPESRAVATALVTRWVVECGTLGVRGASVGVHGLVPRGAGAVLRVELGDGDVLQALLTAEDPRVAVPLRPSRFGVLRDYLRLGVEHLAFGVDHVLFVLGLLFLVASPRALLLTITGFTLGHSVTLSIAALGHSPIPTAWVEVAIAFTLLLLAAELVPGRSTGSRWFGERPWRMATVFGLLHGLGFAGALSEIGLPRGELVTALVSFNVGIELGQLALVGVALVVWRLSLMRLADRVPSRARAWAAAYGLGIPAGYWTVERLAAAG